MRLLIILGVSGTLLAPAARGQDTVPARLPALVTVTRQAARSPYDLPFGITTVSPDSLRPGQAHLSADQTLAIIPGLTVANRGNPSQDPRVSVRGFGARSAFGVRSVRVLRDGMPLTLPDGQTPLDYLDLESVGRIEVIRGTSSALYGNASGGVVDIHSAAPTARFTPEARVWAGSNALVRTTVVAAGTANAMSYQGNVGRTEADNYRQFAHQRLTNAFGRVVVRAGQTDFSVVGMGLHMPLAENPGALTRAQYDTAPRMADPASITKKARKEVDQVQVGLAASRRLGTTTLSMSGYGGTRSLYNPLTFAVVDVDREIAGLSVRGEADVPGAHGLRLTAGADLQRQDDARRNWANCNGVATITANCGVVGEENGVLQLDQRELVTGGGPYARLELERGMMRVNAGVRADAIRFAVEDRYLKDQRDDSGSRTLRAVSPMAGVAVRLSPLSSVYVNYTTAFETPTTTELGNQPDGSAGLNRDLQPQFSRTGEVGAKGVVGPASYELSLFHTRVRDELVSFVASGGRTYYRNAGATRRSGVELTGELDARFVELNATYSYSHFRFADFVVGTEQAAGKLIPGIPEHQAQVSAVTRVRGGFAVVEGIYKSRIWANDLNTAFAPAADVWNARVGQDIRVSGVTIAPMVGVNNAFARKYVGSLAINAQGTATTAPKYYEPAAGRTWIAGARVLFSR